LTYLVFLKMADERGAKVPKDCDWESLKPESTTTGNCRMAHSKRGVISRERQPVILQHFIVLL
jgi:hypothetical protein